MVFEVRWRVYAIYVGNRSPPDAVGFEVSHLLGCGRLGTHRRVVFQAKLLDCSSKSEVFSASANFSLPCVNLT